MATRLPYYVGENDIYSQIMGQQQAAPRTLADYYPGFTGGYDTSLYKQEKKEGDEFGGLLYMGNMGGGIGGDMFSIMDSSVNPANTIAVGQALQSYGRGFGALAPGGLLAGLLGTAIVNSGVNALGAMEAQAYADAATLASMNAVAADLAAAADIANALSVADSVGMSGFGDASAGYGAADGVGASGFGSDGGFGGFGGDGGGFGGGDGGGGDGGGGGGDGGYAKGGKVTMRGLLVDETLPGPDDGYGALQAGEYVIKKSTTKKLGDKKLQALNEGKASIKMRRK